MPDDPDPVATELAKLAEERGREAYERGDRTPPSSMLPSFTEFWHKGWNEAFAKDLETQ